MSRFLALALPALLLLIAAFHGGWELFGADNPQQLAARQLFGLWVLESVGLTALFLLLRSSGRSRFVDGVAAGWVGWVFRGPAVVLSMAGTSVAAQLSWWQQPWWTLAIGWLVLYTLCGVVLALLARRAGI